MGYFYTSDNVKLYYQIDGTKPKVVVLIHGWSGSKDSFRFQVLDFAKEYTVLSFDLRGHGDSEIANDGYTIERNAQDLKELLDYLRFDEVVIVGWSLGAHIAFEYIKQYGCDRLSKLVIVDMSAKLITEKGYDHGLYGDFSERDNMLYLAKMNSGWKYFADYFVPKLYASNVRIDKTLLDKSLSDSYKNSTTVMTRMWIAITTGDYREVLGKITVPTLITYGMNSTLYKPDNSKYLGKQISDSLVIGFENCGHRLMVEDPGSFNKEVITFIG